MSASSRLLSRPREVRTDQPPARLAALAAVAIALATFVCYAPSTTHGFVNWDDNVFVTGNSLIRDLSPEGLLRIFATQHEIDYHPLALLSYAFEFKFFGLDSHVYHLTNVLLHVGNTVLLLNFLLLLTGRLFPAALISLLWGLHPFHVESVTWISERRDVLFTFFSLASLLVYLRGRSAPRPFWQGPASLAIFVLACLSKAMAVTLPAILLLLEHRRAVDFRLREALRRILPHLIVAFGFLLVTLRIRARASDLIHEKAAPALHNLLVASYSMLFYIRKTILPFDFAALYPYPDQVGLALPWPYLVAPAILAALAALLWLARRDRDVVFGSLFYFVTVSPVMLQIPTGLAVAADRYSYFPSIGILFVIGSLVDRARQSLHRGSPRGAAILRAAVAVSCIALGVLTWRRTQVWRDDRTLWEDVLRQFPLAHVAHTNLGAAFIKEGRMEEGKRHLLETLSTRPRDCLARFNLGVLFEREGQVEAAEEQYRLVLSSCPGDRGSHLALADILEAGGRDAEAEPHRRAAVAADPGDQMALALLAGSLLRRGLAQEALPHLRDLARLQPATAQNHNNLGVALAQVGLFADAAAEFRVAMRLAPGYDEPRLNLEAIRPLLEEAR